MHEFEIRRAIRREALTFIAQGGLMEPANPQETVVKLLQLLQKNNPRSIADSTKLIETYLDYFERLVGAEDQDKAVANRKKILTALKATPIPSKGKPLFKYAFQYDYNSKDVPVNESLSKLAVRVLTTFMRTANLLSATEIAEAYQRIYTAIRNSVVPRFN